MLTRFVIFSAKWRAVAALALVLAGCTSSKQAGPPPPSIIGPVWTAETIAGAPVTSDTQITLQLGADGRASGRGGCNDYTGPHTLSGPAPRFGMMAATRVACAPAVMDQEQRYFDTLAQVKRYAVADDGALLLEAVEGKEIRLRRE